MDPNAEQRKPLRVVTTGDVMTLSNSYDENQLWLEFVNARFPVDHPPRPPRNKISKNAQKRLDSAKKSEYHSAVIHHAFYEVFEGVDQEPLPLPEWKIVRGKLAADLEETRFPLFQRDENGQLYIAFIQSNVRGTSRVNMVREINLWLRTNMLKRCCFLSRYQSNMVVFESKEDHAFALLSGHFEPLRYVSAEILKL